MEKNGKMRSLSCDLWADSCASLGPKLFRNITYGFLRPCVYLPKYVGENIALQELMTKAQLWPGWPHLSPTEQVWLICLT